MEFVQDDVLPMAEIEFSPPARLTGEALAFWHEIVPILSRMGTIQESDCPALAMLCDWHARYVKASKQADGAKASDQKLIRKMMAASMAAKQYNVLLARFGLTPKDRKNLGKLHKQGPKIVATRKRA